MVVKPAGEVKLAVYELESSEIVDVFKEIVPALVSLANTCGVMP